MTKEELEKEAEEYFKSICGDYNEEYERTGKRHYWVGYDIKNAYLASAEPREKRIVELEKEIKNLKKTYRKQRNKRIDDLQKENAELRKLKRECETSLCRAEYQYNYEQLTTAKEIIRKLIDYPKIYGQASGRYKHECDLAEQFLKDIEVKK